ncbi:fatty acid synthase [Spodoptera frugiperda]|uniref:Fatty acid synthase n=2 Tax=Spodoptera frugiperda TaxID=7108 RepID=A0A9R0D2A5_SPOFR|nr:fatty acid synthase [Spodoptera frugiperda]
MAPSPQETMVEQQPKTIPRGLTGEELVISGMSGLFPMSDSVLEFKENLYNKVDMVSNENLRWDIRHPEIPKHFGMINGVNRFDAQFFKVHYKQALIMDPMSRKLLEHAYQAIFDAGINPLELRGKKIGVFIGAAFSESEKLIIYESIQRNGFGITGCNKSMYANRISYWLDSKGPSYALDVACSSSMSCLEHAYTSISSGVCEAAIVGGCNLCMHPNVALNMRKYGFLCLDGKTKCFDKHGDGSVRSDAISILFLQKAKDAKRIYSEVYFAKSCYSNIVQEQFLPTRKPEEIQEFLEKFYKEAGVSPRDVEYIEASASAIAEADANELEAIGKVFAKDKTVQVGCVKSNMGHAEPASGVCSLTKVCLAYQTGQIPANLHYYEPQDDIDAVREGRVQVVTENIPFGRGYTALNSFSYSGTNVHVLMKGHYKPKDLERYRSSIPHIILTSGRQDQCLNNLIDKLVKQPVDPEQIALLHEIHEKPIAGHTCRGYTILGTDENKETVCITKEVEFIDGATRPVWFVYSGMGSQWATMGAELMRIPIFAAAIERCQKALEPKGIDIVNILTNPDKTIYDNILHSFVGIAAVQIGLTDILRELGIVPDNIIGHSVGELGCAYADGCFTAEEMILAAYSRGLVSLQTPFIRGSMAAVGLGYKAIKALCPPEIEVACHNSSDSATISGPADIMKTFVADLTARGIFAKEVPCSNIAYHSRYIQDAGPGLLKYLKEVIKNPKERSKKWVSTSVPQNQWDEPAAKYSSAEYHTNNLLNAVLFEETSKLIPANAIVIEVAPHGLLQAILKRSLAECTHIPLTRRGHADPVKFLLEAFGKLYLAGLTPKVKALYPRVEFPVATETPMLSHLVEWEHSEEWPQAKYYAKDRVATSIRNFVISIHDDDYKFFENYKRNGSYVFPEAAILTVVWETLAMFKGVDYRTMPIEFINVHFNDEIYFKADDPLKLDIKIQKGNLYFEVDHDQTVVATGYISQSKPKDNMNRVLEKACDAKNVTLNTRDVYQLLRMRGYDYEGKFQSIHSITSDGTVANIKYTNEWIPLLDSLLQFNVLKRDYSGLSKLIHINKLSIDTKEYSETVQNDVDGVPCLTAEYFDVHNLLRCGGIEIETVMYSDKLVIETDPDLILSRCFVPHFLIGKIDLKAALHVNMQIVAENIPSRQIKVTELFSTKYPEISKIIREVTDEITDKDFVMSGFNKDEVDVSTVFVVDNLLEDEHKMETLARVLPKSTFILAVEKDNAKIYSKYKSFNVVSSYNTNNHILVLVNTIDVSNNENITYMPITNDSKFTWVPRVRHELEKTRKLVLVSERQPNSGFIGMVKKLREEYGNKIALIVVDDYHVENFNTEAAVFKDQIQKKLSINIFKKGHWGGYYNIPSPKETNIRSVALTSTSTGDLDGLKWVEVPQLPACNTMVQVSYVGLSNEDANNAIGTSLTPTEGFGKEFSGININGERVMGLLPENALRSVVEADPDLLWPVPEHWSLEDAATVPLAYVNVFYCLNYVLKSKVVNNKSIFINGAAEPFGQAFISVASFFGYKIYANVEDRQKKEFLLKLFPQLEEKNIACSRIDAHSTVIMNTNTSCCSIVVNCASGPLRQSAMKCVAQMGCILDACEEDMKNNKDFGMFFLNDMKNYKGIRVSSIFKPELAEEKKKIQMWIADGILKGVVRPLHRIVYSPTEVSRAFRLLSLKRFCGNVLIKMKDPNVSSEDLCITPRQNYSADGSYIVVCDESELGFEVADRLVRRGARNLLLNLKPNSSAGYCYTKVASWKKQNVNVRMSSEDLSTDKECVNLIKDGAQLAPVYGIFVIQNYKTDAKQEDLDAETLAQKFNNTVRVVANLDVSSRNLCNNLQHFVVMNYASKGASDEYAVSVIEKICEARNEACLPALAFRVDSINEFDTNGENGTKTRSQKLSTVMNALETSLKLNYTDVVSFDLKKRNNYDFLAKVAKIIGVQHLDDIEDNLTLAELSMNDINLQEMKLLIKNVYNIDYSTESLSQLDVASLKSFGSIKKLHNTKFDAGLGAFYTYTDDDECMATEPMIQMPTRISSATEEEQELDPKETYLIMIPGFEGHHQIFQRVTERLKVRAMTFQLGPDMTQDNIQKMAVDILKFMKKRFELKSNFYLLGYSFGVNVALELAALFEKEGRVGTVYCLDSSPDALKVQLDAYVGNLTDIQLQNKIVEHMYRLMTGRDNEELKNDLEKSESWSEKMEACVSRLRLASYSSQYKRNILESAYRRIMLARQYEPEFKLESQIVLMRGIAHPKAEALPEDYNLSKYTTKPVKVFNIESDHASAPQDSRVSNIINKFLDNELLSKFEKEALCETYLVESFKIL